MQTPSSAAEAALPAALSLGPRLLAVAAQVLVGLPMADVGTDHGLLPLYLLASGRVPRAYALDLRPAPLKQARATALALGLGEAQGFFPRVSDGLAALSPGGLGTVTLAGLGGARIARVLEASAAHLQGPEGARRVVAAPNQEVDAVRAWAVRAGWRIVHEELVEDRARFYPVVSLEPGAGPQGALDAVDLLFGPLLRQQRPPLFLRWLQAEQARLERALEDALAAGARVDLGPLRRSLELVRAELAGEDPA